jgi:hypothetical protein
MRNNRTDNCLLYGDLLPNHIRKGKSIGLNPQGQYSPGDGVERRSQFLRDGRINTIGINYSLGMQTGFPGFDAPTADAVSTG